MNRRVSANHIYEIKQGNEVKLTGEQPRRHSSTNHNVVRRGSLATILFGSSSAIGRRNSSSQLLTVGNEFHRMNGVSPRRRLRSPSTIPCDSRIKHEFNSDNESETEAEKLQRCALRNALPPHVFVESLPKIGRNSKFAPRIPFSHQSLNANALGGMRKVVRIVVVGSKRVGKTAFLQQLAKYQDITSQPYVPTIDDTYQVQTQVDSDDRPKELIIFHDTAGVTDFGPLELKRPYIQVADAFLLVYSVLDHESFNRMDMAKKFIERQFGKEKKEVPIVVIGTMVDLPGRQVDAESAMLWANREKTKLFEVSCRDRGSIVDVVHYLSGRLFHPLKEPKFSITKRLKPEKSNAQIVMDF